MRVFRTCVWFTAALWVAAPALLAFQAEQAAGTSTKAEQKTKSKTKKTGQAGDAAGGNATGVEAATNTGKSGVQTPETVKPKTGSAERAMPGVSESDIAAAKAAGKVWVNTETGVFHKSGRWYGATKEGKFMTEEEALRSGYRAAHNKQ